MTRPSHWASATHLEFVAFEAGGQSFCAEISQVLELRRWTPVTPLPQAAPAMLGVVNLRGAVIPVVDLAAILGLPVAAPAARDVVIVVTVREHVFGLLVAGVSEIVTVAPDDIVEPPEIAGAGSLDAAVIGLIPQETDMLRVLALDAILLDTQKDAA